MTLYYQINYTLAGVPKDAGYFHAQFRHETPSTNGLYTILDGVEGSGQYVGTYLARRVHAPGWWGEGEIKLYLDRDEALPTTAGPAPRIIRGSYNFETMKPTNTKPLPRLIPASRRCCRRIKLRGGDNILDFIAGT